MYTTVKAYRNLNAPKGTIEWSIKPKSGDCKNKVERYASAVVVADAVFKVQPGGADRIKRLQQREVVAWVEGDAFGINKTRDRLNGDYDYFPVDVDGTMAMVASAPDAIRVTYRALMGDHYFRCAETGREIIGAELVICNPDGSCYAMGVQYK